MIPPSNNGDILLSMRRLQPLGMHERNIAVASEEQNEIASHDSHRSTEDLMDGKRSFSNRSVICEKSPTHTCRRRMPFDSLPYYNSVKPRVTIQKRIRFNHLMEPSNNKAMPKDTIEGPLIYERRKNDTNNDNKLYCGKQQAPLALNFLLHPSDCAIEDMIEPKSHQLRGPPGTYEKIINP